VAWFLAAAAVLVAAAVVWYLVGRRGAGVGGVHELRQPGVQASSSDLGLSVRRLWVVRRDAYTSWDFFLNCGEREGCDAKIRLTFRYDSGGRERSYSVVKALRLPSGGSEHVQYQQRPADRVDSVKSVKIEVLELLSRNQPTPTPVW
jgi:hypothetical protein